LYGRTKWQFVQKLWNAAQSLWVMVLINLNFERKM